MKLGFAPARAQFGPDEAAIGTLGWVLVAVLVLVVFGFIGFSFNT